MAVTNYDTVNGQLIGESTGGVTITYLADELGSVVETAQGGAVVNRYLYSPYGKLTSRTGLGQDPRYGWIGARGCRITLRSYSEEYMRARHYSVAAACWTTRDRLWPKEFAYSYVDGRPVVYSDPSGLGPCTDGDGCCCEPTTLKFSKPESNVFYNDYSPLCRGKNALRRSGNWFKIEFATGVSKVAGAPDVKSDCKLRWCECRAEPWSKGGADNQWKEWDLGSVCKDHLSEWTAQHGTRWDCTASFGTMTDAPSMPMTQLQGYAGRPVFPINLFITIVIEAGKPCVGKQVLKILQSIDYKPGGSMTDKLNPMFPGTVQEGFGGNPLPGPTQCQQPSPCES